MRRVELGHWYYLTWHLPATVFALVAIALVLITARSLQRNAYGPAARALRWRILGWSALLASFCSALAWPYLRAVATLRVDATGAWHLANYLGVPLGTIPPSEIRALYGRDLGGVGVGTGHLEIHRADGSVVRTVRISRETLEQTYRALGYPSTLVRDHFGDLAIDPHRYGAAGPELIRR